jgi:Fanconi anemia group M protein
MIEEQVVQIIIDDREGRSGLIEELQNYEYITTTTHVTITTNVEVTRLEVGDVILSDRVGIERKAVADFVSSFIDRDLFGQVADLARSFTRPLVVLEGRTIFGLRDVSPEALRSAVTAIVIGWGVPLHRTENVVETAAFIVTAARREQFQMDRRISIPHTKRSSMSLPQHQVYIIASIGHGVGSKVATDLLEHFGTIERVVTASAKELAEVKGVGAEISKNVREIIEAEYKA